MVVLVHVAWAKLFNDQPCSTKSAPTVPANLLNAALNAMLVLIGPRAPYDYWRDFRVISFVLKVEGLKYDCWRTFVQVITSHNLLHFEIDGTIPIVSVSATTQCSHHCVFRSSDMLVTPRALTIIHISTELISYVILYV